MNPATRYILDNFRKSPLKTLYKLLIDYCMYVSIFFFMLFLLVAKYPLSAVDKSAHLDLRNKTINLIAKISHG